MPDARGIAGAATAERRRWIHSQSRRTKPITTQVHLGQSGSRATPSLADPTRRAILDELTDRDGQTLFELCARLATRHGLGSTRQAISQHIEVLESAGLVTTRREGRYKFHHLDTSPLREIAQRWPIAETQEEQ